MAGLPGPQRRQERLQIVKVEVLCPPNHRNGLSIELGRIVEQERLGPDSRFPSGEKNVRDILIQPGLRSGVPIQQHTVRGL